MTDVLAVLKAERDRLDRAIAVMEAEPKRRGRKPGSAALAAAAGEAPKKRGRKKMSPSARKAVSERMKKYWAERRKGG